MRRRIGGLLALALTLALVAPAGAEQASSDARALQAGWLDAGANHTCAVVSGGNLRCWGGGFNGALGYGNTNNVGDGGGPTPTIASAGFVPLDGHAVRAVALGAGHTCAILDDGSLRCWGSGSAGQLGYGNTNNVGDGRGPTPTIASAGPVPLGGHTVRAVSAGGSHTCAILDDGSVRCWGSGFGGQLGYGNVNSVGTGSGPTPTIASAGPVPLGGHTARAIAAGSDHTCAILDDGSVRCWGNGGNGKLGYGNTSNVGDGAGPSIDAAGPVPLGAGRTARAISAGQHTCAILDDFTARCWGAGVMGQLGYGTASNVGDGTGPTPTIVSAGPIFFGPGRTARAISAGDNITTCATLDDGSARCWGGSGNGQLGYGNTNTIGDGTGPTPTIVSAGPVPLDAGRTARAIVASSFHTCAALDDGSLRCWGGGGGRLGYGNTNSVGTGSGPTPTIQSAGPVPLGSRLDSVADLSLTLAATPNALAVGDMTSLSLTLVNDGPDAAEGVTVTVQAPSFAAASGTPNLGAFDAGGGVWSVGTIPAGDRATLVVSARALAMGAATAVAQVAVSSALDPDLAPATAAAQLLVTAAKDTLAPHLTSFVPRRIALATLRRRGLTVSVTPNEPAAIRFELIRRVRRGGRAKDVVLASRRFALAGGSRTARLVPSRRRLGRHSKGFPLRVRITASDAAGNAASVARSVKVTLGRRPRRR